MREIELNGYIEMEDWAWEGDITGKRIREALYGEDGQNVDDVHITLNSYGGDCNEATRIYDLIRAYPGRVGITISGTAASAGTVIAQAADELTMTPGSLFMIHDPLTFAYGNEADMDAAKAVLAACKNAILNMYESRCAITRDEIAALMTETHWMDAGEAKEKGFIDAISEGTRPEKPVDRAYAERRANAWGKHRMSARWPEYRMAAREKPFGERVDAKERRERLMRVKEYRPGD